MWDHKKYYQDNKELIKKKAIERRKANPQKYKAILDASRKRDPARKLLNAARNRAKSKNLEFDITKEDIIIPKYCPLLNIELSVYGNSDNSPSLDRIDNRKGYIKGNIWVISFKANRMKNTANPQELKLFCSNYLKICEDIVEFK